MQNSTKRLKAVVAIKERLESVAVKFNLIVTTARNLQGVLLAALAAMAAITWLVSAFNPPVWVLVAVVAVLGFGVGVIVAIVFSRLASRSRVADGGFIVTSYEMIYKIDDENHREHSCVRKLKLKAIRNEAHLATFNYNWSGRGKLATRVTSGGHQLLGDIALSRPERCLVIDVGLHDRGDEVDVEYVQDLVDEAGQFHHFIAKVVKISLTSIKLTISLPKNLQFEPEFTGTVERINSDSTWVRKNDLTSQITRSGNSWTLHVNKPIPRRGRVMLRWSWEGEY